MYRQLCLIFYKIRVEFLINYSTLSCPRPKCCFGRKKACVPDTLLFAYSLSGLLNNIFGEEGTNVFLDVILVFHILYVFMNLPLAAPVFKKDWDALGDVRIVELVGT